MHVLWKLISQLNELFLLFIFKLIESLSVISGVSDVPTSSIFEASLVIFLAIILLMMMHVDLL